MRIDSQEGRIRGNKFPAFLALLLCTVTFSGPRAFSNDLVRASIQLDSTEIAFESVATLTLNVEWRADRVALDPATAPKPKLKRLKSTGIATRTELINSGGASYLRRGYRYTLRPTAEGTGLVEPFTIGYRLLADSSVGSVTTSEASLKIRTPAVISDDNPSHTLWLAGSLVLLVAGVVFFLLNRRAQSDLSENLDPLERRLATLKSLTSQPRSKFYTELYQLLDDILHERGITAARSGDTHSIIADIEVSTLPGSLRNRLTHWLEESARQKFAPAGGTPGDTLRLYFEVESALREPWPNATDSPETSRSAG